MQKKNDKSALEMGAQMAKEAAALGKAAQQAAAGNAAGAAVTAVTRSSLVKRALCVLLAWSVLLVCCLCSVPNMIWDAAEQTKDYLEDAAEGIADNAYFVFYGTSDGHEGLTGILTALPRITDTVFDIAKAGWELFTTGEISEEAKESMSESTKMLVSQIYGDSQEKYYEEAQAGVMTANRDIAIANKKSATKLRIQGHIKDIRDSINDDFEKQEDLHGRDENYCHITETNVNEAVSDFLLSLYMIQTNGDLKSTSLAEYDNWLGKSKQTWMETGFFGRDIYEEVPKLPGGESYAADELSWEEPIYHWGGEFLPQDVYEEYDKLAKETLEAESRLDSHFTTNDKYKIRQAVMNGKYKMRTDAELNGTHYTYPDFCTDEAYEEDFSKVWYNADSGKYYNRGAIDVVVYPSPRIRYEYKEVTRTATDDDGNEYTYTVIQFHAYYEIKALGIDASGNWTDDTEGILKDVIRLTGGSLYAAVSTDTDDADTDEDSITAEAPTTYALSLFKTETVMEPKAVLKLKTADESPSDGIGIRSYGKVSGLERTMGWQREYLKDLLMISKLSPSSSSAAFDGNGGGSMIAVAQGEIGTHETGNNNVKYTQWYGDVGSPWCAVFICWCADQLGYLESGLLPKTEYSGRFWDYVIENSDKGVNYTPAQVRSGEFTPCAGDIMIISSEDNLEAASPSQPTVFTRHVALVTDYDAATGTIATIDGNSSDQVQEMTYDIVTGGGGRKLWGFVRPAYPSPVSSGSTVDIPGGESHGFNEIRIDTDGSTDPADMADPYYQSQTSTATLDGAYYDASKVNYVVVPGAGAPDNSYQKYLNCLAILKDQNTGATVNCIVADVGPYGNGWGETSVHAGRALGLSVSGACGAAGNFTVSLYPDCTLRMTVISCIPKRERMARLNCCADPKN